MPCYGQRVVGGVVRHHEGGGSVERLGRLLLALLVLSHLLACLAIGDVLLICLNLAGVPA